MKKIAILLALVTIMACIEKRQENGINLVSEQQKSHATEKPKVLFVTSNATHYGNSTIETSNNFPEICYAYHEFFSANIEVDILSPEGGQVPIGYIHSSDQLLQNYLFDQVLMQKLKNTLKPSEVDIEAYAAVYFVGGGSAMFTVPYNEEIHQLTLAIYEKNNGVVSAVCHGTAGIARIQKGDGTFLVAGKNVSGFPDLFEDKNANYFQEFPFSIQEEVARNGGHFEFSEEGWDDFAIADGRLITGQDPTASASVAKMVIEKIESNKMNP